jgi:hypothetical protein
LPRLCNLTRDPSLPVPSSLDVATRWTRCKRPSMSTVIAGGFTPTLVNCTSRLEQVAGLPPTWKEFIAISRNSSVMSPIEPHFPGDVCAFACGNQTFP